MMVDLPVPVAIAISGLPPPFFQNTNSSCSASSWYWRSVIMQFEFLLRIAENEKRPPTRDRRPFSSQPCTVSLVPGQIGLHRRHRRHRRRRRRLGKRPALGDKVLRAYRINAIPVPKLSALVTLNGDADLHRLEEQNIDLLRRLGDAAGGVDVG